MNRDDGYTLIDYAIGLALMAACMAAVVVGVWMLR